MVTHREPRPMEQSLTETIIEQLNKTELNSWINFKSNWLNLYKNRIHFLELTFFSINNTHYTFLTTMFFIVCNIIHKYCGLNISVKSKKGCETAIWFHCKEKFHSANVCKT